MVAQEDSDGALTVMRDRYVAMAVEIAGTLTELAKAAGNAPPKARDATLSAISRIAAAQEKLSDETRRLPASPVERFALMQSVLQAQQGALIQLALIVKQLGVPTRGHSPSGAKDTQSARFQPSPAQLASPQLGRAVSVSRCANTEESGSFPNRGAISAEDDYHGVGARLRAGLSSLLVWLRTCSLCSSGLTGVAYRLHELWTALGDMVERRWQSRVVVLVIAMGLLVAYGGVFPRAGERPEPTSTRVELPRRNLTAATPLSVPRAEPTAAPQQTARVSSPSAYTRVTMRDSVSARAPFDLPTFSLNDGPQYVAPSPPGISFSAPIPTASGPRVVAGPEARHNPLGPAVPSKPEPMPERTAVDTPDVGFVAVLFTHKEEEIVKRTFTELQHRFPAQLLNRKVESQSVDMGEKGIWHRLVLLPPAPREQADTICQALMAGGYDRCWVKAY